MDKLSSTETYFISALDALTDLEGMEPIINLLLGVYTCHLLGRLETSKRKDLLKEIEKIQEDNLFFLLINRLKNLGFIKVGKITSFPNLVINKITPNNGEKDLIKNLPPKKALSLLRKKVRSSFESHKKKHSKYEIRFFWPASFDLEVYDPHGLIFNQEDYVYKQTTDKYIVGSNKYNIKMRDDELQVKECLEDILSIAHFKKKKIINFPLEQKILEKILQQKLNSYSGILGTPQDLLRKLPEFLEGSYLEVVKERYVRKMPGHTKIEIGLISTQGKTWKTLCIESKILENVLALSLLVNQKNAKRLSYNEFLRRAKKN